MNNKIIFLGALLLGLFLSSCDNDDDGSQKESAKMLSFKFLAANNDALTIDVTAKINDNDKTITAVLPSNTALVFLVPTITLPEGVRIFPSEDFPNNFTNEVKYKVFGDGLNDVEYAVRVTVEDSKESEIKNFTFLQSENANLGADISGKFDDITIAFEFNLGTDITALVPNINPSRGATISPESGVAQDFTNPVKYTVTAQDGVTKTVYTIVTTILKNDENIINVFKFSDINGKEYTAIIDENDISLELPEGTDLRNLTPIIETSLNASTVPASGVMQNFEDILQYEVTAENGMKRVYTVNVYAQNTLKADRAVLTEFYRINNKLDNLLIGYLNWDLSAPNMNDWEGVSMKNNRVTSLFTTLSIRIYELPASVGKLSELSFLSIGSFALREIPKEIGNLKKLNTLDLSFNILTELPKEISGLTALRFLNLTRNKLESIPQEINELKTLNVLRLDDNNIETLPRQLGELVDLITLKLDKNPITVIPKEICAIAKENGGITEITLDIDDVCEE